MLFADSIPLEFPIVPEKQTKSIELHYILYTGGSSSSTKYQLFFCSFLPIPVDNRKFQKEKRSVELRQSFLCTVWAFAEADDREKDSLKVGRIVLSTSAESSTVVVYHIAAAEESSGDGVVVSIDRTVALIYIVNSPDYTHTNIHTQQRTHDKKRRRQKFRAALSILYIPTLDVTNRHPFIYPTQHNMYMYVYLS